MEYDAMPQKCYANTELRLCLASKTNHLSPVPDMFAKSLLVIAILSLFHAAYSVYEHLSRLKALGKPEGSLPLNIVYESIFALILGMIGASLNVPPLKDISWASEMKKRTIDEMDSRLGFANYHSRTKLILVPPQS